MLPAPFSAIRPWREVNMMHAGLRMLRHRIYKESRLQKGGWPADCDCLRIDISRLCSCPRLLLRAHARVPASPNSSGLKSHAIHRYSNAEGICSDPLQPFDVNSTFRCIASAIVKKQLCGMKVLAAAES